MAGDGGDAFRVDSAAYVRAAKAVRAAGDQGIKREFAAALRRAARPLGAEVIRRGAAELPRRGGLARRVAATTKVGVSSSGTRSTINLRAQSDLSALDRGILRHPVFERAGRRSRWTSQRVRPGGFTRPFQDGADAVRSEVRDAIERVTRDIKQEGG